MSNRTEQTDRYRSVIASRLKEMIEYKGITQSDLIRKTRLRFGLAMTSAQISMIMNAKRTLPKDFAVKFSQILDIDPGYLLGADDLSCKSYSDYTKSLGHKAEISREAKELEKYSCIIEPLGYKIQAFAMIEDEFWKFDVLYRGKIAVIPAVEMERFYNDVQKYIKKRLDPLMDLYKEEA